MSKKPAPAEWTYDKSIDPLTFAAFVYRITLPDGRFYIGKRAIWIMKAGKIDRESEWRSYWSSSKEVKALVKAAGADKCQREILTFCISRGEAGWREVDLLVKGDLMLDPLCLNGNVAERFQRKVVQGWSDEKRREKYLKDIAKQRREVGLVEK